DVCSSDLNRTRNLSHTSKPKQHGGCPSSFEPGSCSCCPFSHFHVDRHECRRSRMTNHEFNPHFRPFTANHLAKPYFHATFPPCLPSSIPLPPRRLLPIAHPFEFLYLLYLLNLL